MRAYYYLLYRLYSFYTITLKRKDQPRFHVAVVSTILILFNLGIYSILQVYQLVPKVEVTIYYLIVISVLLALNY